MCNKKIIKMMVEFSDKKTKTGRISLSSDEYQSYDIFSVYMSNPESEKQFLFESYKEGFMRLPGMRISIGSGNTYPQKGKLIAANLAEAAIRRLKTKSTAYCVWSNSAQRGTGRPGVKVQPLGDNYPVRRIDSGFCYRVRTVASPKLLLWLCINDQPEVHL